MAIRFKFRKRFKIGVPRLNVHRYATEHGLSPYWGVNIWRWSWSSRTREWHFDTPGIGWIEFFRPSSRSR